MNTGTAQKTANKTVGSVEPQSHKSRVYECAKRVFDVALVSLTLILEAPVLALISAAIRLTSAGPVFVRSERVGKDGRVFQMLKFRTMYVGADASPSLAAILGENRARSDFELWSLRRDPRITPVGKWLRKTSLDELPQLINVLRGDMTLVGPRPALAVEVSRYSEREKQRLLCSPGITGLWQVMGHGSGGFEEMMDLDLQYVAHASFSLDLKILLRTLAVVRRRI